MKVGGGVRDDAVFHLFYLTHTASTLPRKHLKGFGDFKIGRQVTSTVKYADELVLRSKEEMVLYGMIDRLTENGR
jgi:hypothetical protein